MKHALITGASGFIGGHLARTLASRGTAVTALVRDPVRGRFLEPFGIRLLSGGLEAIPALPADLDAVFHLAGLTRAKRTEAYYTVNRKGTASLLDALLAQGLRPRFVFLSTTGAGGPSAPGRPRLESDPPQPVSPYGRSKLEAEEETLARRAELPVSVVRVGPVYGPNDRGFLEYLRFIKRGILLSFGRASRPMTICYVEDLVSGLLAAAAPCAGTGQVFSVGDPITRTFEDFGWIGASLLGVRAHRVILPLSALWTAVTVLEGLRPLTRSEGFVSRDKVKEYCQPGWVVSVEKARNVLGFEAAWNLEAGLAATIAWYRETGLL